MEWLVGNKPINYKDAVSFMETRVTDIAKGNAEELLWLVEHPPIYTGGTSAKSSDLLNSQFPVYHSARGGQYTYHGPGQRVIYVMLNLKRRYAPATPDVRHFVKTLEQWIIDTLAHFTIKGELREGRIGIWVANGIQEKKIAALGIRIRRSISFHGIAINLNPDLSHFNGIVPCGIKEHGVTSIMQEGVDISMSTLDDALRDHCPFITDNTI